MPAWRGEGPTRCPGVFFLIQTRVSLQAKVRLVQRQIYRLRKPRLRNVARAWKKIGRKKKKRAGKTGASETHPMVGAILCPEDHDTQTKTSPSAESARAGNSSTHQRKQPSDAMPRHAPRGAFIFIHSATAVVKREAGVLSQIRFGRVKSNARDSKPERRPNPELVVIIATFLLQMNVGEDPTGRCKEQEERRWGKLASIVPESHVNPSKPRVETRFRSITHHGRWCPILLLLAVYYHGVQS